MGRVSEGLAALYEAVGESPLTDVQQATFLICIS